MQRPLSKNIYKIRYKNKKLKTREKLENKRKIEDKYGKRVCYTVAKLDEIN